MEGTFYDRPWGGIDSRIIFQYVKDYTSCFWGIVFLSSEYFDSGMMAGDYYNNMYMNNDKRNIDTSNLPRKGSRICWESSINCEIPFMYDGIKGNLLIKDVHRVKKGKRFRQYITLQFNDTIKYMRLSSPKECKLGFVEFFI